MFNDIKKFSKSAAIEAAKERYFYLQEKYRFDPSNGTAQLKPNDIERAVAYGEYTTAGQIISDLS